MWPIPFVWIIFGGRCVIKNQLNSLLSFLINLSIFKGQLSLHKHLEVKELEGQYVVKTKQEHATSCQAIPCADSSHPSTCYTPAITRVQEKVIPYGMGKP